MAKKNKEKKYTAIPSAQTQDILIPTLETVRELSGESLPQAQTQPLIKPPKDTHEDFNFSNGLIENHDIPGKIRHLEVSQPGNKVEYRKPKVRPLSRRYYAVDTCHVGFWVDEKPAFYMVAGVGEVQAKEKSGFNCMIKDLSMCTIDEIARYSPPSMITITPEGDILAVKHRFYPIHLEQLLDNGLKPLSQERGQRAKAVFIHKVAAPIIDMSGMQQQQWPAGAQYYGLPSLFSTVTNYICYQEVPDGTKNSYNPQDYDLLGLDEGSGPISVKRRKVIKA